MRMSAKDEYASKAKALGNFADEWADRCFDDIKAGVDLRIRLNNREFVLAGEEIEDLVRAYLKATDALTDAGRAVEKALFEAIEEV